MNELEEYRQMTFDEYINFKERVAITLRNLADDYITLGYLLRRIKDSEQYKAEGYKTFAAFALDQYGLSESAVSRCINVNKKFSKGGYSEHIIPDYMFYKSSLLDEMLTMSDEERKLTDKNSTVAEIREIKRFGKSEKQMPDIQSDVPPADTKELRYVIIEFFRERKQLLKDIYELSDIEDISRRICKETTIFTENPYQLLMYDYEKGIVLRKTGSTNAKYTWQQFVENTVDIFKNTYTDPDTVWENFYVDDECKDCYLNNNPEAGDFDCHPEAGEHKCFGLSDEEVCELDRNKKMAAVENSAELSAKGLPKKTYPEGSYLTSEGCEGGECFCCAELNCNIRQKERYCVEAPMGHPFSCEMISKIKENENCMFSNRELAPVRKGDKEPVPCCKKCSEKCENRCTRSKNSQVKDNILEDSDNNLDYFETEIEENATEIQVITECSEIYDIDYFLDEANSRLNMMLKETTPVKTLERQKLVVAALASMKAELGLEPVRVSHVYDIKPEEETFNRVLSEINTAWKFFDKGDYHNADFYLFNARNDLYKEYDYERLPLTPSYHEGDIKQPELPRLKNNEQRGAFIDNYTEWPVWMDISETGERYYKYVLDEDVSMVVKVSLRHAWVNGKYESITKYGAEQYCLLGISAKYSSKGTEYKKDKSKTYYECITNRSALIDYLKYIQKKG